MSSTDALLALRNAIKNNESIGYAANGTPTTSLAAATHVLLGSSVAVPKSTPTRWRRPNAKDTSATDPSASPEDFHAIEALTLCWLTRTENAAMYMRQATTEKVAGYVLLTERKAVNDWLDGKMADHERIVPLPESTTPKTPPPQTSALPASTLSPAKLDGASASAAHNRAGGGGTLAKRAYVPDPVDLEAVKRIRANEIELRDRNSVLRGVKANNYTQIKDYVSQLKLAAKGGKGTTTAASATAASSTGPNAAASASSKPGSKKPRVFPIIMVSSSPTALLTLHNIKKFLEESIYESSDSARQRNGGKTEDMIPIYRRRTEIDQSGKEIESKIKYFAVDGVDALAKFGPDAWDRVVCVMTTGQEWQFKPYRWTEPRQLFHHVKGIYFTWTNESANPRTKDWNVSELKIDQTKRHVDKSVVANFWKLMDAWMKINKPTLLL